MIRMSEMVLSGHPDKFCDQIADAVIAETMSIEPEAYGQVEVAAWCDDVWINGGVASTRELPLDLEKIVNDTAARVGYRTADGHDPRRYAVHTAVCIDRVDPLQWTRKVNDQSICVGWAGYNEKTAYLPPEHFLAHTFRRALEEAIAGGPLSGEGPDGKLLVRIREESDGWHLEHLLVTLQQRKTSEFLRVVGSIEEVLAASFSRTCRDDRRWRESWDDTNLLVNPNGPLVNGGSDGDNGQTGRKLVMDFYGPRVAIGGGALSGKHLTHIDRSGAYAAREAAVRAVASGARECRVVVAWAPNEPRPLEVLYEMEGRGTRLPHSFFHHDAMRERYSGVRITSQIASGEHFVDPGYPWNTPS